MTAAIGGAALTMRADYITLPELTVTLVAIAVVLVFAVRDFRR